MAKGKKRNGGKGNCNFPGRVKGCDKIPGPGSCFKQMHGPHNGKCRHCQAEAVKTEKIKVFGR